MKLLFMHNAIPEYRIPWFKYIGCNCDVDFVFTNYKLTQKLYHFDIDYSKISTINYIVMGYKNTFFDDFKSIWKKVNNYDFVEFPPIDSLKEFILSFALLLKCKVNKVKTGYFWEKWEAPFVKQPIKRQVINLLINIAAGIIYRHVDLVFAGSRSCKRYFVKHGVKKEKIVIIPDACETPECEFENLRDKYNISKDKKIILYFGRLLIQKGLHILIEALNEIPDKERYVLIVAGDGENRERCEALIAKYKLKNVIMCGWINPEERKNYFKQCDIFAFPGTFYQGRVDVWGLTVVEAIQNKKIVISSNAVGSAKDLIRNGVNGFIVDAMDEIQMIYDMSKAIMSCDDELKRKTEEYDEKLSKEYSFSNMGETYLQAVKNVLECV